MEPTPPDRLLHAVDLDYYRSHVLFLGSSPAGEVVDSRDLLIACCGFPMGEHNLAILKPTLDDLDAAIERAERYYGEREFPFRFSARSGFEERCAKQLVESGYTAERPVPVMAMQPLREAPVLNTPGFEIVEVGAGADLDDYQRVTETGFGLPLGVGKFILSDLVVERPDVTAYLARKDGKAVATSLVQMSNRVGGIYFVACLVEDRRRGYGEAVTWAAVRGGAKRGSEVASLQASEMGQPVYARMGFDVVARYHEFASPTH